MKWGSVDDYGDDYGSRGEIPQSSAVIVAAIVNRNGKQGTESARGRRNMTATTTLGRTACALVVAGLLMSSLKAGEIPFESSLKEANVVLQSLQDGHGEGLTLGNGDLYGVVWERNGVLTMRVTKNDIWDAPVDTSKDGKLPKVDIAGGKVSGPVNCPEREIVDASEKHHCALSVIPIESIQTAASSSGRCGG